MAFSAPNEAFRMYWKSIAETGAAELLLNTFAVDPSWTPDGERFAFYTRTVPTGRDLWWADKDGTLHEFLRTEFNEQGHQLSPDGRWIAYVSDHTGDDRVYVQKFPEGGPAIAVSPGVGGEPRWSRDGNELFYRDGTAMMAVPVASGAAFRPGTPVELLLTRTHSTHSEAQLPTTMCRWMGVLDASSD